jgi:Domain of unknown function DUF29
MSDVTVNAVLPAAALYEKDWYTWSMENARLLRAGKLDQVDLNQIAEEIEDMGKSEKRAIESHLRVLLMHLLKWQFQPGLQGATWRHSIDNARIDLEDLFDENPALRARFDEFIPKEYKHAKRDAMYETGLPEANFPIACPYDSSQILNIEFWPSK